MTQVLITPSIIAKEALMQLENALVFGKHVYKEYKKEFVKVGATVNIRKPVRFQAKDGATLVLQDVQEAETPITISKRKHVGWQFATQDLTLTIEDYSERYIKPAVIALANQIDFDLASLATNIWNFVGTPGTTPAAFTDISAAAQVLDNLAVPTMGRVGIWNPAAAWSLANGLKGVFVQDIAREALEEGKFGRYVNAEHYESQNVQSFTTGAYGGTPLVNGANQNVSYPTGTNPYTQTLVTNGWSASAVLNAGDVFTIAGVFTVNPKNYQSTGSLQNFTVTATATADGSGNMSPVISPPMIISGPYQNVSAAPASGAAITVKTGAASTAFPQNLLFHPNAFALVTVPLELPDGASFKARETYKGVSIRVVKMFDITNDQDIIRLDVLYGTKAIYPELACRVSG